MARSALVFPFYWLELVSVPSVLLKAAKYPFFVAAFIIEGFVLAVVVVKGLYGSNTAAIRAQLVVVVILVGIAGIFFVVQGVRVLILLAKLDRGIRKSRKARRTIFLFISLGILLFGFVCSYAATYSPHLGAVFPNFLAWYLFFWVYSALASAIICVVLSPRVLREGANNQPENTLDVL